MAGFSARTKLRQACFELLDGFRTSSALLASVGRARPESYTVPMGFVGAIEERAIGRDSGTEHRTPIADVYLVFGTADNDSTADRQDACVDAFIEYCDLHLDQADPATLLELIATDDTDLTINSARGPVVYIATRCRLQLDVWEGRPGQ